MCVLDEPVLKEEYYARLGVDEKRIRRYGRVEYFTLLAETGSLGPYDKEFFFANETARLPL